MHKKTGETESQDEPALDEQATYKDLKVKFEICLKNGKQSLSKVAQESPMKNNNWPVEEKPRAKSEIPEAYVVGVRQTKMRLLGPRKMCWGKCPHNMSEE